MERAAYPEIEATGVEEDRVWVTLKPGADKAKIVEAQFLYTLNPKPFDSTRGNREEWFPAPAKIGKNRLDAVMHPARRTPCSVCVIRTDFL